MGDPVARLEPGDRIFDPRIRILSDEHLETSAREKVETRLRAWLRAYIVRLLGPLLELETAQELTGIARGIAFQVVEVLGVLERSKVLNDVRSPRSGCSRRPAQGRHSLWRLPSLSARLAEAAPRGYWRLSSGALQNGGLDQKGIDEICPSGSIRADLDPGRSGDRRGPLSRRWFQDLRRARGSRRHPGASGGPDPPCDLLSAGNHPRRTAGRHGGWRRFRCRPSP